MTDTNTSVVPNTLFRGDTPEDILKEGEVENALERLLLADPTKLSTLGLTIAGGLLSQRLHLLQVGGFWDDGTPGTALDNVECLVFPMQEEIAEEEEVATEALNEMALDVLCERWPSGVANEPRWAYAKRTRAT